VASEPLEYHLLNKPAGVISTVSDPQGRPTVTQLVPGDVRLFPVGRLDRDTTGLIILTNDGGLAHRLMHPRFQVDKVYRVEVEGVPDEDDLRQLREGILMDEGYSAPAAVDFVKVTDSHAVLEMTIHEGRKRQVRRMLEAVGHPVHSLHRQRYAMLTDKGLAPGDSRPLTEEEVSELQELVNKGDL
jgi:23S rRNA pseudouridine2605 synthase